MDDTQLRLSPGTELKGLSFNLRVERGLRSVYPFDWYEMTEEGSDQSLPVQVLHELVDPLPAFRSSWQAHANALKDLAFVPRAIARIKHRGVFAVAVYDPFSTAIPDQVSPMNVAETLFKDLAAIHAAGKFVGGLTDDGIAFTPQPCFYDLSVVPLLAFAPPEMLSVLTSGVRHLAPAALRTKEATATTDVYALASWLATAFPGSLSDDPTIMAILAGGGEGSGWTARSALERLTGVAGLLPSPAEALPPASAPIPDREAAWPEEDEDEDSYASAAGEVEEEPTGHYSSPSPDPGTSDPPRDEARAEAPPDIPIGPAKARLAIALVAFTLFSIALMRWVHVAYVRPWLAATGKRDVDRSRFEIRLRKAEKQNRGQDHL